MRCAHSAPLRASRRPSRFKVAGQFSSLPPALLAMTRPRSIAREMVVIDPPKPRSTRHFAELDFGGVVKVVNETPGCSIRCVAGHGSRGWPHLPEPLAGYCS